MSIPRHLSFLSYTAAMVYAVGITGIGMTAAFDTVPPNLYDSGKNEEIVTLKRTDPQIEVPKHLRSSRTMRGGSNMTGHDGAEVHSLPSFPSLYTQVPIRRMLEELGSDTDHPVQPDDMGDPFSYEFYDDIATDGYVVENWMVDLLRGMYEIRLAEGITHPLCFNDRLMKMTDAHIKDIVGQELLLSHIGSDNSTSSDRLINCGYDWTGFGATITKTECTTVECALTNRPLFFSKDGRYTHFGIAKESYDPKGDPRWYWVFGVSNTEECLGMPGVNKLEWPVGTPTQPPYVPMPRPPVDPNDGGDLIDDYMIAVISLMNAERKQEGVELLCFNKKLILAAQRHNDDMKAHPEIYYPHSDASFHTGTDGSTPFDRAYDEGYEQYSYLSENVAGPEQPTIREAVYAWMASTGGHGENIIHPEGRHVGIAIDYDYGLYTAVFGAYANDDEPCISSVFCDATQSFVTDDPKWHSYSCALCLHQRPISEFGILGCGWGIDWYRDSSNSITDYGARRN